MILRLAEALNHLILEKRLHYEAGDENVTRENPQQLINKPAQNIASCCLS
jgi:hypothetical protein